MRGLTHDGVSVAERQKIVEVDPRQPPDVFGLGERPRAIARGVSRALGLGCELPEAFLGFEAEYRQNLDCMPMSMRRKLDLCGFKVTLAQCAVRSERDPPRSAWRKTR
ncbi:nitrate reductase associated protein [Variovorax sp. GT1P44]|uniref:nitrate reductase associated protein n=1 Tax=Variovorax sp. GT1P44 TaxID=3443742 RepID=UPI003F45BF51